MERILVIDDDALNLKMADSILRKTYEVICVKSGREGIDILHQKRIDLVLLDLYMPQMSGMETLEKIRADAGISDTKVVVLTSSGNKSDVMGAIRLGALDFIKKPFFPVELLQRIKAILQTQRRDQILVVDDDKMNLMMAKKVLETQYDVFCAGSGVDAIAFLQENTPDLVLLDYHMPIMSGLEVFEKIRTMDRISDVPVIFLTADSERETEVEIFRAGAMDFIQKPFSAEVVRRRIGRILELYHYQKSLQTEVDKKTAELLESNRKVTNLSTQIMMALAGTIDAKDAYTNGHSQRVAEYSRELARRMGKSEKELDEIYYIGLLHDIGKIGMPDAIIGKPGKLTNEEYAVIKAHPAIGAEILKNISEMPNLSIGAHWHHERYDGTGYPDGLKGEEIPEIARIISVADSYDAMASKRYNCDILPQDVIWREIKKSKGTQFDPKIADVMLEMIEEDSEYNMREK